MASRAPTRGNRNGDEESPLLRRTSSKPTTAVWMSVSMIVAGAVVLAVGAAPGVLKTGVALVNGATYHPESAAAEAAVLDAEVMRPDGGMSSRDRDRDRDAVGMEVERFETAAETLDVAVVVPAEGRQEKLEETNENLEETNENLEETQAEAVTRKEREKASERRRELGRKKSRTGSRR